MIVYDNTQEEAAQQLKTLQRRYTQLNQDKDRVEAEKMTLDRSHKARIADLELKLSQSSEELSHFHKELQETQDDDITLVCILLYVYMHMCIKSS